MSTLDSAPATTEPQAFDNNIYAPPTASLEAPESDTDAPDVKKVPVLLVIFLAVVTNGIYIGYWYLSRRKSLNALTPSDDYGVVGPITIIITFTANLVLSLLMIVDPVFADLETPALLLNLIGGVTGLFLAFGVRSILQIYTVEASPLERIRFSGLLTFFFNIYYLQYKINRIF
ncbi:MAG: hypothetical protein AAGC60_09665 [Acidobacteriota bacterium]